MQALSHLAWATDIHLDHCSLEQRQTFAQVLHQSPSQAILLTGDLSESQSLNQHLIELAEIVQKPIYFVLGNHDYYHGEIAAVRSQMRQLTQASHLLRWMPAAEIVPLSDSTALVGHDSWADARHGDFLNSTIWFKDYRLIQDLAVFDQHRESLQLKLNQLGDESAAYFREILPRAFEQFESVIALMHIPPFPEAQWYEGVCYPDEPNWLPHCTCKAVGDALLDIMSQFPDRHLRVLAGHTHHGCDIFVKPNLRVQVGNAVYSSPQIEAVLEI